MLMVAVMLSASAARADLVLTLDNPNQGGSQGQTLNYFGTITSTSGTLTIIGDACTPSGPTTCDDSPLFNLTPFDVPQASPFHGLLFTITIDSNAAYGVYAGSFECWRWMLPATWWLTMLIRIPATSPQQFLSRPACCCWVPV